MKKQLKYIGVDFDGTIVEEGDFPAIGALKPHAKETIEYLQEQGYVLVLWTCRVDDALEDALAFLADNGIEFSHVNENPKEVQEYYGNNPRKLGVDLFIDDKMMTVTDTPIDWYMIKLIAEMRWELKDYQSDDSSK